MENIELINNEQLRKKLIPAHKIGRGEWVDLAGLIAPKTEIDNLLDRIESGAISSIESLSESFLVMQNSYYDWEWTWACEKIEEESGITVNKLTAGDVIDIVERWSNSVIDLDNLLYEDARKEFTLSSMTGFGIDGGDDVKRLDFEQVRGEFESNKVVTAIREHIKQKRALGEELIARLKKIS